MTKSTRSFVVDAGVALKLVLPEQWSDRALALFELLEPSPPADFHVPDLFYIECANTLWKYVRRGAMSEADALQDAARLRALSLQITSTASLMHDGLCLATRHDISAYDACYVALSDRLHTPLVTTDEKLVRKLNGTEHNVLLLGEIILPMQ